MAKITETTPKVERTFTVELTETELRTLAASLSITTEAQREQAIYFRGEKLTGSAIMSLHYELEKIIGAAE